MAWRDQCRVALGLCGSRGPGSGAPVCGLLPVPPVAAWPPALWGQPAGRDGSLCVIRRLLGSRLRSFFPGWSLSEISVLHPVPCTAVSDGGGACHVPSRGAAVRRVCVLRGVRSPWRGPGSSPGAAADLTAGLLGSALLGSALGLSAVLRVELGACLRRLPSPGPSFLAARDGPQPGAPDAHSAASGAAGRGRGEDEGAA